MTKILIGLAAEGAASVSNHSELAKNINSFQRSYAAIYLTRGAQTDELLLMFVRSNHEETWIDDSVASYQKVVAVLKERLSISEDAWIELLAGAQANVYDYLWIKKGFEPRPWPPWSEEPAQVHRLAHAE